MADVPRDMATVGEVVICGDNVMDGYFREPEATAAVMSGPWFHSGDMAVWDTEGYIQIVDRKKDVIISGGEISRQLRWKGPSGRIRECWKWREWGLRIRTGARSLWPLWYTMPTPQ